MSDATFPCVEMICVLDRPDQKRCPSWGEEQFMAEPYSCCSAISLDDHACAGDHNLDDYHNYRGDDDDDAAAALLLRWYWCWWWWLQSWRVFGVPVFFLVGRLDKHNSCR